MIIPHTRVATLLCLLLLPALWSAVGLAAENTCVTCHEGVAGTGHAAHNFADWKKSVHAQRGITCEQCHGGHADQRDVPRAHEGVIRSSDPRSPLYFTHIPEACGRCHTAEFGAFKASYHFRELQRAGRGPNCLTCHGAMATRVLTPQEMQRTCTLCHAEPTQAEQTLVTLNQADALLKKWRALLRVTPQPEQATALAAAEQRYKTAKQTWHGFQLSDVLNTARALVVQARQAIAGLAPAGGTP
ncbi:MAG: hypothetical protein HY696_08355 [Deltaproteobacteria bacterium]|nr:hypothetical protein [Deltaproteobacteria bacterium]